MDKDRDADLLRLADHRAGQVAAGAHGEIRVKLPDDFGRLHVRGGQPGRRLDVMDNVLRQQTAVKARQLDMGHRIAGLGNQRILHIARSSSEKEFRFGIPFFPFVCDGDGRIDMSAGSAAGQ